MVSDLDNFLVEHFLLGGISIMLQKTGDNSLFEGDISLFSQVTTLRRDNVFGKKNFCF